MNKQELIQTAFNLFKQIDLLPDSFETLETPLGLDREDAFLILEEKQLDENDNPIESTVEEINSIVIVLSEYLKLHHSEMNELEFFEYNDNDSVVNICNAIGKEGVLNTVDGLFIFRDNLELHIPNGSYLIKQSSRLFTVDSEEYKKYQAVINF